MGKRAMRALYALEQNRVLSSIKKGFITLVPLLMVGAFALLLRSFPLPAFQAALPTLWGGALDRFLACVGESTFGLLSIFVAGAVGFHYAGACREGDLFTQVTAMALSVACFVATFGQSAPAERLAGFGSTGVFTALLCAVAGTRLFVFLGEHAPRRFRFSTAGADEGFRAAMGGIAPALLCVAVFAAGNLALDWLAGVASLNELITAGASALFSRAGNDLSGGILFTALQGTLWMFGIHGGNALDQVATRLFVPANADPTAVVCKSFLDNFALIGGCGATICLLLALLLFSRSKDDRRLAGASLPFGLFGINEILVYGLPVILNPIYLIPFILVPICSLCIAYFATWVGFLPVVTKTVAWTTPVLFSGYIAVDSWRGAAVQLVIVAVGTAIYAPFVKLSDRVRSGREQEMLRALTDAFQVGERAGERPRFLDRGGQLGAAAKQLASRLRADLQSGAVPFWYQPQVDADGHAFGAESLLRWRFGGQLVYPPLAISLAQEEGVYGQLTELALQRACRAAGAFRAALGRPFSVSVNLTATQLDDPALVEQIIAMAQGAGVRPGGLGLEVTEETTLIDREHVSENIGRLWAAGIPVSVDDFSMGHTSLRYLQENPFRYVKLDGSLVRQVTENARSREIVSSLVSLGTGLSFDTVAEQVETAQVRDALIALGCTRFQGYLYSPAVPLEECLAFCREEPWR